MAAHESSVDRSWVSGVPDERRVTGGDPDGFDRRGAMIGVQGQPPAVSQSLNCEVGTEDCATDCLFSEGKRKDIVQPVTEDGNAPKLRLEPEKISRDPFSAPSSPRSQSTWFSAASSDPLSYGESSMMNEAEGSDGSLPEFVRIGGPFGFQGAEMDVGFEDLAAHLSVSRLKGKLDGAGESSMLPGSMMQFRDLLHSGSNLEALFGSGSLSSSPPSSSLEGLPVRGENVGLDAALLQKTQGMLQAIRAVDVRMGSEMTGDHGHSEDLQPGLASVQSRTDLYRLRFPDKPPDKLHRKRAKTYPPSYLL